MASLKPALDPCEQAALAPYLRRAEEELAGTRFSSLLSLGCQREQLCDLAKTLRSYACDTLDRLVAAGLARRNPLWAADTRLAPAKEVARERAAVASRIESSGGAALDEGAPLLRAELDRQTERFVSVAIETSERIWNDRRPISRELLGGGPSSECGRVLSMTYGFADCHHAGRRTTVVTCESGRFVYKPHDCQVDVWFLDFATRHMPDALAQPYTLLQKDASGAWGFQGFVERRPLEDERALERYWYNMGRALALFQVLGSQDLHAENFVAAGDRPSLVDCETVLAGMPDMWRDTPARTVAQHITQGFEGDLSHTLASSSLLPGQLFVPDNIDPQILKEFMGSYDVTQRNRIIRTSPLLAHGISCLPLFDGRERDVLGFEDVLLDGFDEGLELLAANAASLMADLQAVANLPIRQLLRDTSFYVRLLARLRRADAFDPRVRERILAGLLRSSQGGSESDQSPLALSEAACLRVGDVPYFQTLAGSHALSCDGATDNHRLAASASERALERITALDDAHRRFAREVVESNVRRAIVSSESVLPPCPVCSSPLPPREALAEVKGAFDTLEDMTLLSPSGEESWLFRSNKSGTLCCSPVSFSDGLSGMAVFLAAFAAHTPTTAACDRARELLGGCLHRLDGVVTALEEANASSLRGLSCGLTSGLGGFVRSLDLVVRLLEHGQPSGALAPEFFQARLLRSRLIAVLECADMDGMGRMDVYDGVAGLLLALSHYAREKGDDGAYGVAKRLVRLLLDGRKQDQRHKTRFWRAAGSRWPISGFGHGQAGVAAALVAARDAFGLDIGDAAAEALEWEIACYSKSLGTWPDLRESPSSRKFMRGLCSGAPGIGLAALSIRNASGGGAERPLADTLLELADAACATTGLGYRDTLCCGTLSVVEYLLARHRVQDAGCILAGIAQRRAELGHFVFVRKNLRAVDEPALFGGLAGVGYEFLRYADASLPSVFVD